jgi:hypothetical protein
LLQGAQFAFKLVAGQTTMKSPELIILCDELGSLGK